MNKYWMIFKTFFRASNVTFGGGPAMIPLVRVDVVDKYEWVTEDEFTDMVAVSTALPAPIITKLAAMVTYPVAGWMGVLVAQIAIILPTALAVVLLGSLISQFADTDALKAMMKGVRPVIIVLLLQVSWSMGRKAFTDWLMWAFGAAALVVLLFAPWIHPAFLIAGSMILGYAFCRKGIQARKES